MKKVLVLDACVRGNISRSKMLLDSFLTGLEKSGEEMEITVLDLCSMDLKPLIGEWFESRQTLLEKDDRTNPRFDLAHQFADADLIACAAPFWDLSIPAVLKLYIENISVDGITFGCNESGIYGICKAKKMVFLTTRGCYYGNGPQEVGAYYLKALCGMFGIDAFECIAAEGLDADPDKAEEFMGKAVKEAIAAGEAAFAG